MERSRFWEADRSLAGRGVPHILCNFNVHYRIHHIQPLDSTFSYMNPVYTLTSPFFKTNFIIILSSTSKFSRYFGSILKLSYLTAFSPVSILHYIHALSGSLAFHWLLHLLLQRRDMQVGAVCPVT
jgi:hypothetical protein